MVEIRHDHCVMYTGQNGLYYAGLCPFVPTKKQHKLKSSVLPTDPDLLNDAICGPYVFSVEGVSYIVSRQQQCLTYTSI